MLVHGFILVECIGFEFKIEFEFKLVEYCLEKKRGRKTRKGKKPKKPSPKPSFLGPTRDPFFPSHPAGPVLPSPSARSHSSYSAQAPRPSSPPFTARPSSFLSPSPRTAQSRTANFTAQPRCAWPAPLRHLASAQRPRRARSSLCHAGPTCRPFRLRRAAPLFAGSAALLAAPALWATRATSTAPQSPLPAPPAAYAF